MKRLWIVMIALIAAGLACNLGGSDNDNTTLPTLAPPTDAVIPTSTPAQSPAPTLTPTPFLSATPQPTSAPACTPRTAWPTLTVSPGDTLFGIALRVGSTVDELVAANCLGNANTITVGQRLYVPNVPPPPPVATATPQPSCAFSWFFALEPGTRDPLGTCPEPVVSVSAAGQDFEGGRALWYAAPPGSTDPRGTIYIIYNNGYWETYPDVWESGMPESDPSLVPPPGRYQPIRGIGQVWRDHASVRNQLGWAYEPEQAFTGRSQEPSGDDATWAGRIRYWYLDHGKWGIALRLYSVDMGPNTWEVAGRY